MDQATFNRLLSAAANAGASDVHLKTGAPPAVRLAGALTAVKSPALAASDMERIAGYLLSQRPGAPEPSAVRELDTSYAIEGIARFRVSIYRQRGDLAAVLRIVPFAIPSFASLGLPAAVEKIAREERGLVLVTGVAGSGKSSTLAAMIDFINANEKRHILTIEDPIEFLHSDKKSRVCQREVGIDTPGFGPALRAGLRQDPDVILIGEMRDLETMDTALKAAETGHLVLATLHTTDASRTISRILGTYPADAQFSVRMRLAEVLKAVVCQRLVPAASGKGLVLAAEVLVSTLTVQDMIRDPEKIGGLKDYIERGGDVYGMQSFDQHLVALQREGKITMETALAGATSPSEVQRALMLE
ncbi:PilT/PilU family type 4a pilus ATPase [Acidobacteria bacterium ACD]|nr:MAG: PilT/PilU family type 4a pilus ATPase [Acidobacteriota bacterium]MCE7958524.1 PilT/PilU family type 4a pilus ATPase [Acidobacteria bacterium ACB2]MDL1949457.1 PilT/PilU family type 4a pilus ATPase [Acidobacteria bacterium ACD]